MSLSVYISELLKTNDCVIIPDLGGFIANFHASGYDEQGDQFSPPSRALIFSGKLKKNDGIFVNYVSEKEAVGYLEARKMVSEFVSECMFHLENGEKVPFGQLGSLYFGENDQLLFEPTQEKTIRTDMFGLDSFHFPQLVNKYTHPAKPVFLDKDPEPQRQRKNVLKYALLVVPLLAAFYLIPKFVSHDASVRPPTTNNASLTLSDSPVAPKTELMASPAPIETQTAPMVASKEDAEAVKISVPAVVADHAPASLNTMPAENLPTIKKSSQSGDNQALKGKFHLVGGCFKVKENADKLADKLVKLGYPAQVSNLGKNFFRVSVQSFQTRKEAENALGKLIEAEPGDGYWLMAAGK